MLGARGALTAMAAATLGFIPTCTSDPTGFDDVSESSGNETTGEASIFWDAYGVPHIDAQTDDAGYYALGWAQMETRANLVLELYARARGEQAQFLGEKGVQSDLIVKSFELPKRAEAWHASMSRSDRNAVNAYVAGMNAWAIQNRDKLSPDLAAILPIQHTDPLAHYYQIVHLTFVSRRQLSRYLSASGSPGSNAIAIAPSRSASGNAMLVANPHLNWSDLFTWTEVHIENPSYEIYGAALTGVPYVGVGFNRTGGWTHTVNQFDGVDLYNIREVDDGYVFDDEILPFETREVQIDVRQPDNSIKTTIHTVRDTVHGTVLPGDNTETVSARIYAWDSPNIFSQYFAMAAADSLEAFELAQSQLQMPFFNTIYANRDGDILFFYGGRIPKRNQGDWNLWQGILPGDSSDWLPSEYHGYEEMPKVINPETGFVQNANEPPWFATWPQVVRPEQYPAYFAPDEGLKFRPQRSLRMVLGDASVTFEELLEMKQSNQLETAVRFVDALIDASTNRGDAVLDNAANVLSTWDRAANTDSRGTVLFLEWMELVFSEEEAGTTVLSTEDWRIAPLTAPNSIADTDLAASLLREAAQNVLDVHGDLSIAYGDVYRVRRDGVDLPASGADSDYGSYRVSWFDAQTDHTNTIYGGDSFVAVIEFGEDLRAFGNLGYGNFDAHGTPSNTAALKSYSAGELRPLILDWDQIRENAVQSETINFKSAGNEK